MQGVCRNNTLTLHSSRSEIPGGLRQTPFWRHIVQNTRKSPRKVSTIRQIAPPGGKSLNVNENDVRNQNRPGTEAVKGGQQHRADKKN